MTAPQPTEAASAAASWWGDRVRTVRAETDGIHPDLTHQQAYAATVAIGMRATEIREARVDDHVIDAFVQELARLIDAAGAGEMILRVDYHPDGTLARAADTAGLPRALFPAKTTLWIDPDQVLGKAGYGTRPTVVWSAEGWERPLCGAQEWPEDAEDPTGPACAQPRWHDGRHDWEQAAA